jgi:4-amino-4-deoxy-L-arabinose transferase-like glycosyltransferase
VWLAAAVTFNLALGNGVVVFYALPWKDIPYMLCLGYVTYMIMQTLDEEEKSPGSFQAVLVGVAIAFSGMFRYNGIIAAFACFVYFIIYFSRKKEWLQLLCTVLAAAVSIVAVYAYSSFVLHTKSQKNGFSVQVFGSGIAAVVAGEGNVTEDQMMRIESRLPVGWMIKYYEPWNTKQLIWTSEVETAPEFIQDPNLHVFVNRFVLALGENRDEVIKLYFELLPHNLGIMLKDIAYNTYAIWGAENLQDYFYSNAFSVIMLVFLMLRFWSREIFRKRWAVFLPVFCNMLSIAVSTITNEARYLLPTFALFPFLAFYIIAERRTLRQSKEIQNYGTFIK